MSTILNEFKKADSQGTNRTFVEFECDRCLNLSSKPKKEFNINKENFCCRQCWADSKHEEGQVELSCDFCNKRFKKLKSHLANSKSGLYFCCRACKDKAQRLESGFTQIHPSHYGEGSGIHNYREIAFRLYEKVCFLCGYLKMPEILEVHHIDRNRHNNDPSNLRVLCPNCHREDHFISNDGQFSGKKKDE